MRLGQLVSLGPFTRVVLSAAFALLLLAGPAAAWGDRGRADVPGRFDYYVLSLSWSPTYCETERKGNDDEQCARTRPFAFVVHGLWPQFERGYPQNCARPAPFVPKETIRGMLDVMPSWNLVIYEWRKHGTCSGLGADAYFNTVRRAYEKVVIPPEFTRLNDYRTVSPDEVEKAFQAANPGLDGSMMSVQCSRRRLSEVRICLSKDLKFQSCTSVDNRACRQPSISMPPVRGG